VPSGRWVIWRMVNNFGRRDSNVDEGRVSLGVGVAAGVVDEGITFTGRVGPGPAHTNTNTRMPQIKSSSVHCALVYTNTFTTTEDVLSVSQYIDTSP
jgi:hypothetical protein